MGYTLKKFASECHDILSAEPGPKGREKVRNLLQKALVDKEFVAETFPPSNTEKRKIIYEDKDLGFCICSHFHEGAAMSKPHDHGKYWAIYGQVEGTTEMFDYKWVEKPSREDTSGKVEAQRSYTLKPGDAHLYNEGDVHAPKREATTKLVRIEGRNLDTIKRVYHEEVAAAPAE